jgi:hypothetical protein
MHNDNKHGTGAHLDAALLISIAAGKRTHPHIEGCAFCREQVEELRSLAQFEKQTSDSQQEPDTYRLAAMSMSVAEAQPELRLRHTWYLEEGDILLRVFEDRIHDQLLGYIICDTELLSRVRIRFSGIDKEYAASEDGSFSIGPSSIDIEPMHVVLAY